MRLLIFALLACAAPAAVQTSWPVVLPMTLDKNLPLVQISVKRTQLTFVVDSAASGCLISKQRAEAIGLKVAMEGVSSGSGGFQSVGIIRGVRLWLGGMQLEPADCYTFDLTTLKFKSQVDGVPGSPLFRKYVVEIDYPGSRVRVFPPRRHRPSARAQVYRVRVAVGPIARGSIRVRGKAPIALDMQLDAGSSHVLTICTPVVDRYHLLDSADELRPGNTRGVGGPSSDVTGRIEKVRLGRFAAVNPEVRLSPADRRSVRFRSILLGQSRRRFPETVQGHLRLPRHACVPGMRPPRAFEP